MPLLYYYIYKKNHLTPYCRLFHHIKIWKWKLKIVGLIKIIGHYSFASTKFLHKISQFIKQGCLKM